eukprot:CAMPEP_0185910646 /NCGR_PEP_ID=MMETSP0196C-20130402/20909_1 /TAXON_ID=2932 /ORGANISM="Alexandrium fundyense, Strain CCMP1719" /LENGTH=114 /DNA_ID=CAMNT_0028631449 /DNA_START=102 /DNA_END=443 /DNA_ORIENTATION=+
MQAVHQQRDSAHVRLHTVLDDELEAGSCLHDPAKPTGFEAVLHVRQDRLIHDGVPVVEVHRREVDALLVIAALELQAPAVRAVRLVANVHHRVADACEAGVEDRRGTPVAHERP